jgi:hypothetical protein
MKMAEENNLVVFSRELDDNKVVAIFNLSDKERSNAVSCNMINGSFINTNNNNKISYTQNQLITLQAWEYLILIGE